MDFINYYFFGFFSRCSLRQNDLKAFFLFLLVHFIDWVEAHLRELAALKLCFELRIDGVGIFDDQHANVDEGAVLSREVRHYTLESEFILLGHV